MSHWSPAGRAVSSFPRALLRDSWSPVWRGGYRQRATRVCVSIVFLTQRKIDARQRDLNNIQKKRAREEMVRSKRLTAKVIARQPPFCNSTSCATYFSPLSPTRPFQFFDDTVVVSPITHHGSIVNQNAALSGTKVPNKIHKFPLYCAHGGFRQKFSKFRK